MKVLVDLSNIFNRYSGVAVYSFRILRGFKERGYKVQILCNSNICEYIEKEFPCYERIVINFYPKKSGIKGLVRDFQNGLLWSRVINHIDCDIIFSPVPKLTYIFANKKIIQTIHDLQELKVSKGGMLLIRRLLLPVLLLNRYKLITISEYVKNEIKRIYPFVSSDKIQTIYNSVIIENNYVRKNPISVNYILYVGTLREYKNVYTLLKSFNLIKDEINHKLVIIGKPFDNYWDSTIIPFIKNNHLEKYIIHVTRTVTDKELAQYYSYADLLIHPSLFEGFGYTPIEAGMYGIPVLTTKETALYETTMGLLNYYEPPKDETILAKKIVDILSNRPTNQELDMISTTFLDQYDYIKQADKIWNFIKENVN